MQPGADQVLPSRSPTDVPTRVVPAGGAVAAGRHQAFVVVVARTVVLGLVVVEVVGFFGLVVVVVVLPVDFGVVVAAVDEPDRRAHVTGPTMPSLLSPLAFWNDMIAACV